MKTVDLPLEKQTLLWLLSSALFGAPSNSLDGVDLGAVFSEANAQAVLPIVWDGMATLLSQDEKKRFSEQNILAMKYLQNNMRICREHTYLHHLMQSHSVPYCVLKGTASAYYYPNPSLRMMGDVDFLVSEKDVPRSTELLKSAGFTPWEQEHICHIVFRKEHTHLEMHFDLPGTPEGKAGEMIHSYVEDIFDSAETVGEFPFCKPSNFHHGLILLLHTYHHMLSEGIGLRHLCDIAVFLNHFTDNEFTELFLDKLSAVGLWKFAQIMAQTCHIYLGLPYRKWMGEPNQEVCFPLIQDIFSGGNFGRKDAERSIQGVAISNRGKDGVKRGFPIFKTLNRLAENEWEIFKRNRFLHGFGWIPMAFRYLRSIVSGKRKPPTLKTFQSIKDRKQLYEQFELFEDNKKQ